MLPAIAWLKEQTLDKKLSVCLVNIPIKAKDLNVKIFLKRHIPGFKEANVTIKIEKNNGIAWVYS